jgi:D-cysteine desulfhydrase family pyridoxal phosphate-dependent enzyme
VPLERITRAQLASLPTPLEDAPRLSAALGGGARVLIKRDDLTGLAFGGNKVRKLEYLIADALSRGADTVVTQGPVQSNHCRQTAAAAAKVGLGCVLVMNRRRAVEMQGNFLLDALLGASARIVDVRPGYSRSDATAEVVEELRSAGRRPYVIPTGGSNGVGALGYARFVLELQTQLIDRELAADALYFSTGSGGTQGGLLLGARLFSAPWRLVGISPGDPIDEIVAGTLRDAREGAELVGLHHTFSETDLIVDPSYGGAAYEEPTAESEEAIRLFARTEGIILDPVYTAKAAAGMVDHVRNGLTGTVIFLHTGGTPALFAFPPSSASTASAWPGTETLG